MCCIGLIELKLYALLARIGKPPKADKVHVVSQDSPKLLDRMRAEIRLRHYSLHTEQAFSWQATSQGVGCRGGAGFSVLSGQRAACFGFYAESGEVGLAVFVP